MRFPFDSLSRDSVVDCVAARDWLIVTRHNASGLKCRQGRQLKLNDVPWETRLSR